MTIMKKMIQLAQHLGKAGLEKEANILDGIVRRAFGDNGFSSAKTAHSSGSKGDDEEDARPWDEESIDMDLIAQWMQAYMAEGSSLEEAMEMAVRDLERLQMDGDSFSVSEEERSKAKGYVPIQVANMFPSISE